MSRQENKFTNIQKSNIITGSVGGHVINVSADEVNEEINRCITLINECEERLRILEIQSTQGYSEDASMSAGEAQEEIDHCLTLVNECKKRVRVLEIQVTQLGLHTPPYIQVEIDDSREKIRKLELRIKELRK